MAASGDPFLKASGGRRRRIGRGDAAEIETER
jgi:hypothetical protein